MYGADCVEGEVDPETAQVKILKAIGAHDVGKAINPLNCEGQNEDGLVHGIGPALYEQMLIGPKGELQNTSLLDYKICRVLDVPDITPLIIEATHRDGPYGAKRIG